MGWYSEAGQDQFAYEKCGDNGTFLDMGCAWPDKCSNTLGLEERGWRGLLVDKNETFVDMCRKVRASPAIVAMAEEIDWGNICAALNLGPIIDYLSLDLDEGAEMPVQEVWHQRASSFALSRLNTTLTVRVISIGVHNGEFLYPKGYFLERPILVIVLIWHSRIGGHGGNDDP